MADRSLQSQKIIKTPENVVESEAKTNNPAVYDFKVTTNTDTVQQRSPV